MLKPTTKRIETAELGKMRRELIQMLIDVDPVSNEKSRESVFRRIERLRNDGVIPDLIGDFMHIVRKCRNRAEYEGIIPQSMEAHTIQFAWFAIQEWHFMCNFDVTKNAEQWLTAKKVKV